MIGEPHNDRQCLDAVTTRVADLVHDRDPALVAFAEAYPDTESLAAYLRSLPQRNDDGLPCDGPKVTECEPVQRYRVAAPDPNCLERAADYIGAAELIDPAPVRRLAWA